MPLMKKFPPLILSIALLLANVIPASAQYAYKSAVHMTFGKVSFDLYCKMGTFGFGQQFYPANFYNQSFYDIHVKGEYVATLTCGNEAVSQLDFTCKKYSSIIHVDVNDAYFPYGMPKGYGSDFTGLVPSADEKLCPGNEVTVQGWTDGSRSNTRDRITALNIRNLKLFAIQEDGSEVPMTDEGVLISPPANTQAKDGLHDTSGSKPNPVTSTPPPSSSAAASGISGLTPQQQVYQQQANNYLNAANHSSDAIQQSMNTNLAAVNAAAAGNTVQAAQIRQTQEQQTQANNAAVAQGISDLGSTIGGLIASGRAKKEREKQELAENERWHEQLAKEEDEATRQEEAKMSSTMAADSMLKMGVVDMLLGPYAGMKNTSFSTIDKNISTVYCVAIVPSRWTEGEDPNRNDVIYNLGHEYTLFPVVTIRRAPDGSWPQKKLVNKALSLHSLGNETTNYDPVLSGFFATREDALNFYASMRRNFHGTGSHVEFFDCDSLTYLTDFGRIDSLYDHIGDLFYRWRTCNLLKKQIDEFLQTYTPSDYPKEYGFVTKIKSEVRDSLQSLQGKRKAYEILKKRLETFKRDTAYVYLKRFVDTYNSSWDNLSESCKSYKPGEELKNGLFHGKLVLDSARLRVTYINTRGYNIMKYGFSYYNIYISKDQSTHRKYVNSSYDPRLDDAFSIILSSSKSKCKIDNAEEILLQLQQMYNASNLARLASIELYPVED
jgi:hypothetical protein